MQKDSRVSTSSRCFPPRGRNDRRRCRRAVPSTTGSNSISSSSTRVTGLRESFVTASLTDVNRARALNACVTYVSRWMKNTSHDVSARPSGPATRLKKTRELSFGIGQGELCATARDQARAELRQANGTLSNLTALYCCTTTQPAIEDKPQVEARTNPPSSRWALPTSSPELPSSTRAA